MWYDEKHIYIYIYRYSKFRTKQISLTDLITYMNNSLGQIYLKLKNNIYGLTQRMRHCLTKKHVYTNSHTLCVYVIFSTATHVQTPIPLTITGEQN